MCLLVSNGVLIFIISKKISWFNVFRCDFNNLFVSIILSDCNVIGIGVIERVIGGINFNIFIIELNKVIKIKFFVFIFVFFICKFKIYFR